MKVVERAAIAFGVDDRDRRGREPREVLRPADLGERAVLVEQVFQRDRAGHLAAVDQLADRVVDAAVHRIGEVLGREEIGDAAVGRVVDEDRAEQCLLRLGVPRGRRNPVEIAFAQRGNA